MAIIEHSSEVTPSTQPDSSAENSTLNPNKKRRYGIIGGVAAIAVAAGGFGIATAANNHSAEQGASNTVPNTGEQDDILENPVVGGEDAPVDSGEVVEDNVETGNNLSPEQINEIIANCPGIIDFEPEAVVLLKQLPQDEADVAYKLSQNKTEGATQTIISILHSHR